MFRSGDHQGTVARPRKGDATWAAFGGTVLRGVGRGLRWLAEQVVDLLGEFIAAALACLVFGGFLLLAAWGFSTAPRSTALLLTALTALTTYGGWRAWRGDAAGRRGLLARLAVGWFVFVAVWLAYVFAYCSCR